MPNTIEQVVAYAVAHPKRDGRSWSAWCESFVYRAGGFNQSFSTALIAGNASGWLNPDWRSAPRGAIHHWAGVYINGVECGHTCFELGGGWLLMASSRVSTYGTGLGIIHFTQYGLPKYRGWTMRHGRETLAGSSLAGTGKPIPVPEDDMYSDADRARDERAAERSRQIEAVLTGKIDGKPVDLNPGVNWGQSVLFGVASARVVLNTIAATQAAPLDLDALADKLIARLPLERVGELTAQDVVAEFGKLFAPKE